MTRTHRALSIVLVALALLTGGYCTYHAVAGTPGGSAAAAGSEEKVLYLTFDDGPGDETVEILELLEEYDAAAVFFALGDNLSRHPDLGRRIVAEGHALANHTWTHSDLTSLGAGELDREIGETADLLADLGSDSPCLRPPYGATDEALEQELTARGLRQVLWNVDTADWSRPDGIVEELLGAESGDVVLLHDGGGNRTATVAALRQALPRLAEQGYAFDVVPGC